MHKHNVLHGFPDPSNAWVIDNGGDDLQVVWIGFLGLVRSPSTPFHWDSLARADIQDFQSTVVQMIHCVHMDKANSLTPPEMDLGPAPEVYIAEPRVPSMSIYQFDDHEAQSKDPSTLGIIQFAGSASLSPLLPCIPWFWLILPYPY